MVVVVVGREAGDRMRLLPEHCSCWHDDELIHGNYNRDLQRGNAFLAGFYSSLTINCHIV